LLLKYHCFVFLQSLVHPVYVMTGDEDDICHVYVDGVPVCSSTALTFRSTFALNWWFNKVFIHLSDNCCINNSIMHVLICCWLLVSPSTGAISCLSVTLVALRPFSLLDSQLLFHTVKCTACMNDIHTHHVYHYQGYSQTSKYK